MDVIVFAKGLAFVAFAISCYGYTRVHDNQLRLSIAISCALLSLHFLLLGAWVAALSLFINAIRNQLSRYHTGLKWFLGFAFIQLITSFWIYQTPQDILPIVASLISGYAVFCCKNIVLRIWMLICTLLWFANNLLIQTYGAVLSDLLSMSMNIYGMLRLLGYFNKKHG